jgi:N-methylhydantoinase B
MVTLAPGDSMISIGSAGGGYGSPLERDAGRVLHDVNEGLVSPERAREVYGVVIVDGSIDEAATAQSRGGV